MKARLLLLLAVVLPAPASAQEWGSLRGRFVVEGQPPALAKIVPEKDPFCEKCELVNEAVIVGQEGGLKNAVVYLRPGRGEEIPVHPDYASAASEAATVSNEKCRFTPRVTLLLTGQELIVKNADPTAHNTKFDLVRNSALNSVIPAKDQFTTRFDEAETLPMPVSCNIHPFMRGYVLVRDDPYMVVTGEDGVFEIKNLPAGWHEFQFWHETGYLKNVAFEAGEADRRGRVDLTIPAGGELDLGEITVRAELLVP